ncbi:MAG: hypothetical protein EOP24_33940 [Hyphomicrobiales bacterium]|nr:MAG: hypothetical protein EOP24_33940 [Hyphomicrobiales bacterium]
MSTSVSHSDQIQSLKRTCPFFTAQDIAKVTGFSLRSVAKALRQMPQDSSGRLPVYAARELAD